MEETQHDITETPEYCLLESIIEVGEKLNPYIDAVCVGKPLGLPEYDMEAEQWAVYFEESPTPWSPDSDRDIVAVQCGDAQEATDIYNHYNQYPVKETIENEKDTS